MDPETKVEIWKQMLLKRKHIQDSARKQSIEQRQCIETGEWVEPLQKLQVQIAEVRKYVKIWIKQEKMQRNKAAIKIQAAVRRYRFRLNQSVIALTIKPVSTFHGKDLSANIDISAIVLQKHSRGFLIRKRIRTLRMQYQAATLIQAQWRGFTMRSTFEMKKHTGIKKFKRGGTVKPVLNSVCYQLQNTHKSVVDLQQGQEVHEKALRMLWNQVDELQKKIKKQEERTTRRGLIKFQTYWRAYSARKTFHQHIKERAAQSKRNRLVLRGVIKCQTYWRGFYSRKIFYLAIRKERNHCKQQQVALNGCIRFQTAWRRYIAMKHYKDTRVVGRGVKKFQMYWRGYYVRKKQKLAKQNVDD